MANLHQRSALGCRLGRVLAAALLAAGLTAALPLGAQALPPDGPGPETPGTSSRVWPSKVKAGDRLYFEVSGYPANETVYIKIDDGLMCSDTSHGACVYHTQKLNGKGYAKGSLVVPNLAAGKHWLRMLATGDVFDSKTGEKIGYKGYTRRGGNDFTVVAGGKGGSGTTVEGGGATNADGTISGGSVSLNVDDETATPAASPEASPTPGTMDDITTNAADDPDSEVAQNVPATTPQPSEPVAAPAPEGEGSNLPVVGIAVLAGAVVAGGGAIGWALVRRNRLLKPAAPAGTEASDTGE